MTLLLFDLDGTLTDTMDADDRFFIAAVREVAGVEIAVEAWENFPEVTDPAVARALISRATGRMTREGELFQVRAAFAKKWERALAAREIAIRPIVGAPEIFQAARVRNGFCAAIATGGWGPTALLKLQAIGLPAGECVVASADDAEARASILRTAAIFAAAARGIPGFSDLVVVGDALWDARAARDVKAGFVGVASDEMRALRLRAEGAAAIVPDFSEPEKFWSAVDAAIANRRAAKVN